MPSKRGRNISESEPCDICGYIPRNAMGLGPHRTSCRAKQAEPDANAIIEELYARTSKRARLNGPPNKKPVRRPAKKKAAAAPHDAPQSGHQRTPSAASAVSTAEPVVNVNDVDIGLANMDQAAAEADPGVAQAGSTITASDIRLPDDIRVRYHSSSGIPDKYFRFEDYKRTFDRPPLDETLLEQPPWHPFQSRADFEFAEICLDASLNRTHVNSLLKLFAQAQNAGSGEKTISFTTFKDVEAAWAKATLSHAPFQEWTKEFQYRGETRKFEFFARDIWDIAKELIQSRVLAPHWSWNPMRLEKWNAHNGVWERLYDEPVTADGIWDAQDKVRDGGTALALYLYADKTRLSSFGTQQGYPIILRFPQLDQEIRNGAEYGGGIVVGFLPVLKETAADKRSDEWRSLKGAVWHECFRELLRKIRQLAKAGEKVLCGDGIVRIFYAFLLILSADYEEQVMMALTRSAAADHPCPVCLVSKEHLKFPATTPILLRNHKQAQDIVLHPDLFPTQKQREKALQSLGLHDITNAFWLLPNFNVHKTVSFDRLHSYHSGLFGNHLFGELKRVLKRLGKEQQVRLDQNFTAAPRWRDMDHFSSVANVHFTDANKYEGISKLLVQAACSILPQSTQPIGYELLRLIRAWIELDMYMSFELHTDATIAAIEEGLRTFENRLESYEYAIEEFQDSQIKVKSWLFPKIHMHCHAPADIRCKGVTRNYNTKPNEKVHGILKEWYLRRTNFKNVEHTLSKIAHCLLACVSIRAQMDTYDELQRRRSCDSDNDDDEEGAALQTAPETTTSSGVPDPEDGPLDEERSEDGEELSLETQKPSTSQRRSRSDGKPAPAHFNQIHLGAGQRAQTIDSVMRAHSGERAFADFGRRLQRYLTSWLRLLGVIPPDQQILLYANTMITEYRFLKVDYESRVTWKQLTDHLRCSEDFFGVPRNDGVIYQKAGDAGAGTATFGFAKLSFIFTVTVLSTVYPIALVQRMDFAPRRRRMDDELTLYRLRTNPNTMYSFIPARSIIRGAYLYPAPDCRGLQYFAVDTIDADMYLRIRDIFSPR